ncbi:MAG TPA: transcriptional regulator BetI [Hypericibacter adhaerens]|jgi:TetR/AcrR family transcriptional repressor of bet genes|uniref:transcriptional regulator BetI n=1 Tax=Hypericibacter adhaerens TaxID=2602016 RepID=UPI002B5B02F4|nr:transcriptional regulator BetI [Hypericibacter adhaerens]HWA43497.1 transcriptional regulator BetI [Hypericibacter adhaerens]
MGRAEIKEIRRTQLIEATIDMIARHGFAALTLADIAKAAHLSSGIVNFYFRSKEELLIATFRHLAAGYERSIEQALARAGDDPAEQLAAVIEADSDPRVAGRKHVTVWYAFWGEARWRPEYLEVCAEISDRFYRQTRALCAAIAERGGYRDLDLDAIARGFNAMSDGLWLELLTSPKSFTREDSKRISYAFFASVFPKEFAARARPPQPARAANA